MDNSTIQYMEMQIFHCRTIHFRQGIFYIGREGGVKATDFTVDMIAIIMISKIVFVVIIIIMIITDIIVRYRSGNSSS